MDIGTAKPTRDEMCGVPHHLIDELMPDDAFSAALFTRMARERIDDIHKRGLMPIIAGGTGFYIKALLSADFDDEGGLDTEIISELQAFLEENGAEALHRRLAEADPASSEKIHPNNVKRVMRAIEFWMRHGIPLSRHNSEQRARPQIYDVNSYCLRMERAELYNRINVRIDKMISDGLFEEVKSLLDMGYAPGLVSMQGLGYKESAAYFAGDISHGAAIELIKKRTRNFAKRQLTWFRHQHTMEELDAASPEIARHINLKTQRERSR